MVKQNNIPQLRFPEFREGWDKKKLGELSKINPTTNKLPDKFIYIDLESVTDGELTKEVVVFKNEAPSRAQRVLEKDDILFQMVRPYQKNNLYFDKIGDYVASTGYAQVKTKQCSRFIYQYLHLKTFVDEVIERCTGTSYPAINSKDLARICICYPTVPEQQKIASFFTAIDQKISQLKQKKSLLVQYKKGAIQKIFSQQIRFKDDNGHGFPKWENKRLGEFLIKHEEKTIENNQYPVLTSSRRGIFFQKDYFDGNDIASKDNTGYNVVPKNFFTYRHMSDDLIFRFNKNTICEKGIVSTLYPVFTTQKINDEFLQIILNEGREFKIYAIEQKQGGSRTYIYFSKLVELMLKLPCLEEQIKIASFLSAIDNKINHTQKQMEKAEVWKKTLMQQMFV